MNIRAHGSSSRSVAVIGTGRMGRAFRQRFEAAGFVVSHCDWNRELVLRHLQSSVVLIALRFPEQVRRAIELLRDPLGERVIVDLTTQSPSQATGSSLAAKSLGLSYFGGGTLGGAREAERGKCALLLGPPPPPAALAIIECLGKVVAFPSASTACAIKLLHNFVLIWHAQALGAAISIARDRGVLDLPAILALGPAGREMSTLSVVRDSEETPTSSYTAALVAKDLQATIEAFPQLNSLPGFRISDLIAQYSAGGEQPYTAVALQCVAQTRDLGH